MTAIGVAASTLGFPAAVMVAAWAAWPLMQPAGYSAQPERIITNINRSRKGDREAPPASHIANPNSSDPSTDPDHARDRDRPLENDRAPPFPPVLLPPAEQETFASGCSPPDNASFDPPIVGRCVV